MRKHVGFFLGTVAGACLTLLVASPQGAHLFAVANAAAHSDNSNTYSQLNLFGEVFEKIKTDYVEKPEDGKLVEGAINGMPRCGWRQRTSASQPVISLLRRSTQGW